MTYRIRKKDNLATDSRLRNMSFADYTFLVKLKGADRERLAKALEKLRVELGFPPSNPMLLSVLLKRFLGA